MIDATAYGFPFVYDYTPPAKRVPKAKLEQFGEDAGKMLEHLRKAESLKCGKELTVREDGDDYVLEVG